MPLTNKFHKTVILINIIPMLTYCGLTEIVGEPGTGKTAIAIEESKLYRTLYLTSTNFPIQRYDFNKNQYEFITIKLVQSITELLYVLNFSLGYFIANSLELLVIDDLFHIIFIEKRSRKETTNIVYRLKKLIQSHNIKVLVVNTSCTTIQGQNRTSFSSKLGLNWEYNVNTKYRCVKEKDFYILELLKTPVEQKSKLTFKIHKKHIEICENEIVNCFKK